MPFEAGQSDKGVYVGVGAENVDDVVAAVCVGFDTEVEDVGSVLNVGVSACIGMCVCRYGEKLTQTYLHTT